MPKTLPWELYFCKRWRAFSTPWHISLASSTSTKNGKAPSRKNLWRLSQLYRCSNVLSSQLKHHYKSILILIFCPSSAEASLQINAAFDGPSPYSLTTWQSSASKEPASSQTHSLTCKGSFWPISNSFRLHFSSVALSSRGRYHKPRLLP